jgi:hypothetical protein
MCGSALLSSRLNKRRQLWRSIPKVNKGESEGEGKSAPCIVTERHTVKEHWGIGGIAPRIFDFGTRWI